MDNELFIREIRALEILYSEVKDIIILSENLIQGGKTPIGLMNEIRNAFDHVMRSVNSAEAEHEFNEAREHLKRAGYDAYELIASDLSNQIDSALKIYDSDIISKIFPAFYTEHKPLMLQLKEELAHIRANKKIEVLANTKSFREYADRVNTLNSIFMRTTSMIPDLEHEATRKKNAKLKEEWRNRIIVGIIVGVVSAFIIRMTTPTVSGDSMKANIPPVQDSVTLRPR